MGGTPGDEGGYRKRDTHKNERLRVGVMHRMERERERGKEY